MNEKQIEIEELKKIQLEILRHVAEFCDSHNIKYRLDFGTLIGCVRHKGYIPWDDDIDIGMLRKDYDTFMELFNKENTRYQFKSYENDKQFYFAFGKVLDTTTILYEPDETGLKLNVNIDVFPYDNVNPKKIKKLLRVRDRCNICEVAKRRHGKPNGNIFRRFAVYILQFCVKFFKRDMFVKKIVKNAATYRNIETGYVADLSGNVTNFVCKKETFENLIEGEFEGYKFHIPKHYDELLRLIYGDYMQLPPENSRFSTHVFKAYLK